MAAAAPSIPLSSLAAAGGHCTASQTPTQTLIISQPPTIGQSANSARANTTQCQQPPTATNPVRTASSPKRSSHQNWLLDFLAKTWLGNAIAAIVLLLAILALAASLYSSITQTKYSEWSVKNDALQSCISASAVNIFSRYCNKTIAAGVKRPPIARRSQSDEQMNGWTAGFLTGSIFTTVSIGIFTLIYSRPRMEPFHPITSMVRMQPVCPGIEPFKRGCKCYRRGKGQTAALQHHLPTLPFEASMCSSQMTGEQFQDPHQDLEGDYGDQNDMPDPSSDGEMLQKVRLVGGQETLHDQDTHISDESDFLDKIRDSLDALSLTANSQDKIDRHPERRFKATYNAFKEKRLEGMKDDKSLRRNQKIEQIRKEFDKQLDNPFNQVSGSYNMSKDEMKELRQTKREKEGLLTEQMPSWYVHPRPRSSGPRSPKSAPTIIDDPGELLQYGSPRLPRSETAYVAGDDPCELYETLATERRVTEWLTDCNLFSPFEPFDEEEAKVSASKSEADFVMVEGDQPEASYPAFQFGTYRLRKGRFSRSEPDLERFERRRDRNATIRELFERIPLKPVWAQFGRQG